jgi:hypothetical protein
LAQLLKAFADSSFDRLPSSPLPPDGTPDSNSLTLACARYQHVSLSGFETKLAPLLSRLDTLKARATTQSFYLLLTSRGTKMKILEWPFSQIHLSQIESRRRVGAIFPSSIHDSVPEDFLSQLAPLTASAISMQDMVYASEGGQIYSVRRDPCTGSPPHCTFENLTVRRIQQATVTGGTLHSPDGLFWPGDLGIALTQVGPEGYKITSEDYEKNQPFYSQLYDSGAVSTGSSFIEGGYVYQDVRVCRVNPQAKPSPCINRGTQPR